MKAFVLLLICSALLLAIPGRAQSGIAGSTQQYGAPFANVPAREDVVIYQVNMRAFSKQGNFAAVTARLDSIKALGVNVIYLMPIYPVGKLKAVNSPYCIRDYASINTEFGTMTDLRTLIDGAHRRNMSVILDWVGNHTSWDHPWITAHKDWYKQDSTGKIVTPGFGWNDVAQLDYTNSDMRLAMIADMKYWVYAANIDGFRCDYADGPPVDFWAQAIDTLRNIHTHKLLFLAEGTRSANFTAGFDYNFGFKFFGNLKAIYDSNRPVRSIDTLNITDYTGASGGQQIVRYTTNHDVNGSDGTPIQLFGGQSGSMAAFAVIACMKGIPFIYNGQEVGMQRNIPFPFTSVKIDWTPNPSVTAAYKKLIAIHNNSDAIRHGILTSYTTPDICSFTKTTNKETIFVLSNMRSKTIKYSIPHTLAHTSWTDLVTGEKITLNSNLKLPSYKYLVLEKD